MQYYLSLGANLGNREQTINQAIEAIEQQIGHVDRCSSFYYSEPWGFESTHGFCNVCCLVETEKAPLEVLALTQEIEKSLGRTKKTAISLQPSEVSLQKKAIYSDRTIDIDLIRVFENDGTEIKMSSGSLLILPHPLWKKRDFVKIPLKEILDN